MHTTTDGSAHTHSDAAALSMHEAARVAGCGRTTLYAAIYSGDLKARKLGRRTLIRRDDLMAWLDSLPAIAPTKAA